MPRIEYETGVVVAVETSDIDTVMEVVDSISKVRGNFVLQIDQLFEQEPDVHVISDIRDRCDLPIIYNGINVDIPQISTVMARTAYNFGADAVIVGGFAKEDAVKEIVKLGMGDVIAIAEISHPGWGDGLDDRVVYTVLGTDISIIAPHPGLQGPTGGGFQVGATYEVIDSKIYENGDPGNIGEYCYDYGIYCEQKRRSIKSIV